MKLRPNYMPLEITLVKQRKKKVDLRNNVDVSSATISKLSRNEPVSLSSIIKICEYLECDLQDVVVLEEVKEES